METAVEPLSDTLSMTIFIFLGGMGLSEDDHIK